jgi:hypothetical protein
MLLESVGIRDLTQQELYDNECHDPAQTWFNFPTGIAATIANHDVTGLLGEYSVQPCASAMGLTRKSIWMIENKGRAPVVLVRQRSHWVLLVGYESDRAPVSADDGGYEILTLYVQDPNFHRSSSAPTGSELQAKSPYEWFCIETKRHVPTGEPYGDSWVMVGSSDPEGRFDLPNCTRGGAHLFERGDAQASDESKVSRDFDPLEAAESAIREQPFAASEPWSKALQDAHARWVIPVQDLEFDNESTFLVPFQRAGGDQADSPIAVRIDGETGKFRSALVIADSSLLYRDFPRLTNRAAVLAEFSDGIMHEPSEELLFPKEENLSDTALWRPCQESLSPFLPFWRFSFESDEGPARDIFVRVDDKRFFTLTDPAGN